MTAVPFAVGVTGHRPHKLNMDRIARIEADVRSVFVQLQQVVSPRPVECICSLAEGADSLAARIALTLGWRLVSPLPFPLNDFADDFEAGPVRDAFYELAGQATIEVCTKGRATLPDPDLGYIAASAAVLERVSVLVAVWDGQGTELLGGAYDTIRLALAQALPVVWIDANGAAPPRHIVAQDERSLASSAPRTAPLDALMTSLS